jgi:translation initiation factor eIF-2B subunit delta
MIIGSNIVVENTLIQAA